MSDQNMSGQEPMVPEGTVTPLPAPPMIKPGTARRNVLLIVAGVIVLVALVGFVGYAIFLVGSTGPGTPGGIPVPAPGGSTASGGTGGTGSTATTTAIVPAVPTVGFRDVFTPRNPFTPIKPVQIAVPASTSNDNGGGSNNNTSTADNSNTLFLQNIITEDSVLKAVVRLNGVTYTLAAGSTVDSSSWSIQEVNADNIVALFGDVSVTLTIGQGSSQ